MLGPPTCSGTGAAKALGPQRCVQGTEVPDMRLLDLGWPPLSDPVREAAARRG